jgi:proteasome beta subunit
MTEDQAIELAVRGLKSAMKRDAGSGEGIHVVVVTKDKFQAISEDEVKKYLAKTSA